MKPHLQATIWTLLKRGATQREIERITGISRHTIRSYQQRFACDPANCPGVATDLPTSVAASSHLQPRGARLGQKPGRRHRGHHHPGPTHAPLRDAGVRGQELPFEGGRLTHRRHARLAENFQALSCYRSSQVSSTHSKS